MAAIAKYVFVGGALTLVADYIKMHHIDWLVMNGGFVGFNIAAYELDKFKGKKTVRTFNSFSLSNFRSQCVAKVPALAKRTDCTLSTLWKLHKITRVAEAAT